MSLRESIWIHQGWVSSGSDRRTGPLTMSSFRCLLLPSFSPSQALPQEIPIIREFACDWYYKRNPALIAAPAPAPAAAAAAAFHLLAEAAAGEERCQIPQVSKLAGEVVTVARMFNAVISEWTFWDLILCIGRPPPPTQKRPARLGIRADLAWCCVRFPRPLVRSSPIDPSSFAPSQPSSA